MSDDAEVVKPKLPSLTLLRSSGSGSVGRSPASGFSSPVMQSSSSYQSLPGTTSVVGVPSVTLRWKKGDIAVDLLEFLETSPDQMDLIDFLAASAPTTSVVLSSNQLSGGSGVDGKKLGGGKDGKAGGAGGTTRTASPVLLSARTITPKHLPELVSFLQTLGELSGRSHVWGLKRYNNSFTGDELVSVLLRKSICSSVEEAERVAQLLIDEHYVWQTTIDMSFKDARAPFRFITPQIFRISQLLNDPQKGIASFKAAALASTSASAASAAAARKESISLSSTLFEELRKAVFSGTDMCDWLLQHGQIKPKTREQAVRTAQLLLDHSVIHTVSTSAKATDDSVFFPENKYGISREKITSQSLQSLQNRKEVLVCSLGEKSKWKNRLCILVAAHQCLYVFTDEASITPRTIINLRSSIVREVDESYFGRPNCVQITTDAGWVILEAPTKEAATEWATDLSSSSRDRSQDGDSDAGRQSRSLRFRIVDGINVPSGGNYFCSVIMGEAVVAKTQVQRNNKASKLTWNEEFFFMEVPSSIDDLKVTLSLKGQLQDQEIGTASIKLSALSSHVEVEEWFVLKNQAPVKKEKGSSTSTPQPNVFLRFTLEYELILPLKSYEPLVTLATTDFRLLSSLLSLTKGDREQMIQWVLRILISQNKAKDFVMELANREIAITGERTVLFRVNTVGTKAVVEYMKLAGYSYIRDTLRPFVQNIDKYGIDLEKSASYLPAIRDLFDLIYQSVLRIPSELFLFFHSLSDAAISKFADEGSDEDAANNVGLMVVNGFFFLRLLCPAVVSPKLYGVIDYHLDERATLILKNLARILQYLANFKAEVDKDVFDAEGAALLDRFLNENIPKMKSFIRQIASEENGTSQRFNLGPTDLNFDLERDLASLYAAIIRYNQELIELLRDASKTNLTNVMEEISASYKKRWPGRSTPYQYKISLADAMLFLK